MCVWKEPLCEKAPTVKIPSVVVMQLVVTASAFGYPSASAHWSLAEQANFWQL